MNSGENKSYGVKVSAGELTEEDLLIEQFQRQGYAIVRNAVNDATLVEARERLDAVYASQLSETGEETLRAISELKLARAPFLYDSFFRQFYQVSSIVEPVRRLLGDYITLHLQNGILNPPDEVHHQSKWHRDLPYQEWTSSRPLAVGALFCIDAFSRESGGTYVLPHSHRFENFPSDDYVSGHEVTVEAEAGSVILFDAMLYHRAGENRSQSVRRGLNHVYTIPLLKQQIDFPTALGDNFDGSREERKLLGYECRVPVSVEAWRKGKVDRLK